MAIDTFGENFDFDTFKTNTFENDTFESVWVDGHSLFSFIQENQNLGSKKPSVNGSKRRQRRQHQYWGLKCQKWHTPFISPGLCPKSNQIREFDSTFQRKDRKKNSKTTHFFSPNEQG